HFILKTAYLLKQQKALRFPFACLPCGAEVHYRDFRFRIKIFFDVFLFSRIKCYFFNQKKQICYGLFTVYTCYVSKSKQ
ncbi:hypothetical protein C2768_01850, partial [Pasteurella multocida]|nr:hypothetical protein [Pasteurella multocida]